MKKISLILIMLLISVAAFSQQKEKTFKTGNLSVKTVEYATWIMAVKDKEGREIQKGYWDMDGPPSKYIARFKVSKNIVTHINATEEFTYFIESTYVNQEMARLECEITDENGASYTMIVDSKNSNLRFIYSDGTNLRLTRFKFESSWVEI